MPAENLGNQLIGVQHNFADGGIAQFYERGMVIKTAAGESVVSFNFPLIGHPHIATPEAALELGTISFTDGAIGPLVLEALTGRVGLLPSGAFPALPLSFGPIETVNLGGVVTNVVPASASLQERQLYDVVFRDFQNSWHVVAPNAVYYRSSWHDFGIAHVTDIHVARRIDSFRGKLRELGRVDAANNMYNWNDRFRGFVRYANYLHGLGVLDVILATGDLYDYSYEDDDPPGESNANFMRNLILGQAPGPDFPDVERLRVPIFMVPGNHDYRKHPYGLVFNLVLTEEMIIAITAISAATHIPLDLTRWLLFDGGKKLRHFENHSGYNLRWQDAAALTHGANDESIPEMSPDEARRFLGVEDEPPFTKLLVEKDSYTVRLGDHRIIMLNSAHDEGIFEGTVDGFLAKYGLRGEDKSTLVAGSPNCVGVTEDDVNNVRGELERDEPAGGLFIVGIHAPLFNFWDDANSYFMRETQRPVHQRQVEAFLVKNDTDADFDNVRERHPYWFGDGETTFVKRGGVDHLLRFGVSRGPVDDFLEVLAGVNSKQRKADVVLSGHTHAFNEFRVEVEQGTGWPVLYTDFYTFNPREYYACKFYIKGLGYHATYVEISSEAERNATPWPMPYEATYKYQLTVPPYYHPLATSPDPRQWWAEHRPLVLQSESLGPMKSNQVNFTGFRLLSVKNDVIEKIHFVSIYKLEAGQYRTPWEEVIKPDPQRVYKYIERSRYFNIPGAAGSPVAVALASGETKTVYRDGHGMLWELIMQPNGVVDHRNLTEAAQAAPASGDPSIFQDPQTLKPLVIHRGDDGHVHSIYWTPDGVASKRLSASVEGGVPKAATGTVPTGHYTPATNTTMVHYRDIDDNIQTLYWIGDDAVRSDGAYINIDEGWPLAQGNPWSYLDTDHTQHVIAYRGQDDHIHSLYWRDDTAVGHDNLSAVAGAPQAAGDPVAYYIPSHTYGENFANVAISVHQFTYRSVDGELIELWWKGEDVVQCGNLTQVSNGPKAASDPFAYYEPVSNTKHVFYYAEDGHLHELWWVPLTNGPQDVDLTVGALAPPAAQARPYAFTQNPTRQHVIYRGTDNQIHEIHWP
jgi:hypothetical protein